MTHRILLDGTKEFMEKINGPLMGYYANEYELLLVAWVGLRKGPDGLPIVAQDNLRGVLRCVKNFNELIVESFRYLTVS